MTNNEKKNYITQELLTSTDEAYCEYLRDISQYIDSYDIVVDIKNLHNFKNEKLFLINSATLVCDDMLFDLFSDTYGTKYSQFTDDIDFFELWLYNISSQHYYDYDMNVTLIFTNKIERDKCFETHFERYNLL